MANPGSEHPEHSEESSLKEKIFQSAIALFAEYGLNGARMEQIAEKAGTTKRMVVYHFKNKENLYLLVLEHVYTEIRASEKALSLADMPPVEALVHLVQVRLGPDRFAYLAIARTKPRNAPIPFSQLIVTEEAA